MTRVLEAWDRPEHRHVALKVPSDRLAGDKAFLERLEREAQTAASLTHPNIAAVHGVGYDTRIGFVVTELVEGPSRRGMLADRGPLPPVGAATVAAGVCAALAAAHRRGVAHGHLTPANVLLAIDGRVKVTDFRLVQAAKPSATASAVSSDRACAPRSSCTLNLPARILASGPTRIGRMMPAAAAGCEWGACIAGRPRCRSRSRCHCW